MGYWIGYICMGFVPVQPPRVIRGPFWSHLVSTFKKKVEKKKKKKNVNSVPLYALRGIEYFICIVREVSRKEILCFIFDRVVSPCWVFFLFAESRSLSTMRGPLWDSIGGGGGAGWVQRVTGCI